MSGIGAIGVRVLFLGGLGRSGTTLVERLLGELPGVCCLGELVHLWQRGVVDNERCGCGEAFGDCSFWQAVGERAFGGWDTLDVDGLLSLKSQVDRTRYIPELAAPRLRPSASARVAAYVRAYRAVYEAACDITGCDVLVDSSKHASLAYCLRWCTDLDVRVVHMVRDSRGVAYSWWKQVERPEGTGAQAQMARLSPAGAAAQWNAQNAAFGLLPGLGLPTKRIRYEDVTADPRTTLREMAGFAGAPPHDSDLSFLTDASVDLHACHTVSGNPMRFQTGRVALRRDDAWHSSLPFSHRRAVTAMTWPLLLRYNYVRPPQPNDTLGAAG